MIDVVSDVAFYFWIMIDTRNAAVGGANCSSI
jgi:hypothetical protein